MTTLRIAAYDVELRMVSPANAARGEFVGRYDSAEQLIEIKKGLSEWVFVDVLIHEILHCLWYQTSLEVGDTEERIVSNLGNGLSQVIRDNPNLWDLWKTAK